MEGVEGKFRRMCFVKLSKAPSDTKSICHKGQERVLLMTSLLLRHWY